MFEAHLLVLTMHHTYDRQVQKEFKNCLGDCQAIINPVLELKKDNVGVFGGLNSIGEMMLGVRGTKPITKNLSFTYGTYYQNYSKYSDKGIAMPFRAGDFVPLVGLDYKINNFGVIVTPVLSSLYLSF